MDHQLKFERVHDDIDRLLLRDPDFNSFSALSFEFSNCFVNELGNFRRHSFAASAFGVASDSLNNGGS